MRAFDSIQGLRAFLRNARHDDKTVGFVPTMGAFHAGHVSLMQRARTSCDIVVVSIFVNPTQFGPNEDFTRYPRHLQADSRMAQDADVDALFTPTVEEMYPAGFQTVVTVPRVAARWEGERRPSHFAGVATVVTKLFGIVLPDRAYFGQKDYQQLKVIERLVTDLSLPVRIVPCATERDPDGLAMSSRNRYLDEAARRDAAAIPRALQAARALYEGGCREAARVEAAAREVLDTVPAIEIDYIAVADAETLEPVRALKAPAVILIAARLGSTRLIDNITLGVPEDASRGLRPGLSPGAAGR